MMKTKTRWFLALPLIAAACGGSSSPSTPAPTELRSNKVRVTAPAVSDADAATFAYDNLAFAVHMHLMLRMAQTNNFVFSQTSISTALAMVYAGAGTTTATGMATAVHFLLPAERLHPAFNALDLALNTPAPGGSAAFRLALANSLWLQDGFAVLPSYLDMLAENYGAGVFVEDFVTNAEDARHEINGWVSNRTEAQIPELFPEGSFDAATRLVLTNAVFFHGDWKAPFRHDATAPATFHALAGDVSVPMMHGERNAALWTSTGWTAAALDYVGDTTSMILVVPDAGTFETFEAALSAEVLSTILAGAQPSGGTDLIMPKLKFETGVALTDILSALGMREAFSDTADFSGIDGARDLSLQSVIHKAVIAVDEKGTTAAAATGAVVGTTSVPPTLVVDRPFLFFIRHNPTGAILFQGRVVDPSK
jgi:serpin B